MDEVRGVSEKKRRPWGHVAMPQAATRALFFVAVCHAPGGTGPKNFANMPERVLFASGVKPLTL